MDVSVIPYLDSSLRCGSKPTHNRESIDLERASTFAKNDDRRNGGGVGCGIGEGANLRPLNMEDRGRFDSNGMYCVTLNQIDGINRDENVHVVRILYLSKSVVVTPSSLGEGDTSEAKIVGLPLSTWHGCLKNVPGVLGDRFTLEDGEDEKGRSERLGMDGWVVVVTKNVGGGGERRWGGPVLVLQGLRYR